MTHTVPEPDINRPLTHQVPGINNVAYSPDGRVIATSDVQMNVVVRLGDEVISERNLASEFDKIRPTERIRGLQFSANGNRLFVAAADTVHALNPLTSETIWSYEPPRSFGFLIISPVALTAEGGLVAASFDNGSVAVWDEEGNLKCLWQDNDAPRKFTFTAEGTRLIGTDSFSLCVWDATTRDKPVRIPLPSRAFGFAASRYGRVVAMRTLQEIVLWDVAERRPIAHVPAEPGLPVIAFHPKGELLAVAARDAAMLLDYDGQEVARHAVPEGQILAMAFRPDGRELALGLSNETLQRIPLE